ncbi:hypothetical protein BJ165DRAFT_1426547, partial [Panaeolus papilionaceus]
SLLQSNIAFLSLFSPLLLVVFVLPLLALLLPYSLISGFLLRLRLSLAPHSISLSLSSITLPGPPRWRRFQYLHNLTAAVVGTGWRVT